jgi:hypothetical protein
MPRALFALALPVLLLVLTAVLALALAPAAGAATVTVRVEGLSQTLLAPTQVGTDTTPVVKDGNEEHKCPGTSAAGALERATGGSWNGEWFTGFGGYSVETILGETHAFEPGAAANYFWSYWLDNKAASTGICEGELQPGESILFFPECFSETGACPPPPNPLAISAPTVAERGAPVNVTVTSYDNASGAPSPAAGAAVSGGGVTATTDSTGHATLAFAQAGTVQLQVTAPGSVRTEASVCVHAGNDGTCGTTGPSGTGTTSAALTPSGGVAGYKGPFAIVAQAGGVRDGHVYPRRHGPRLLTGTIATHASVASVSLELRRSYRGRCFAYDGAAERFKRARCGQGRFFAVGSAPRFSYLLPAALPSGRYVLDVQASDVAGNRTALARGSSRIVFYVR